MARNWTREFGKREVCPVSESVRVVREPQNGSYANLKHDVEIYIGNILAPNGEFIAEDWRSLDPKDHYIFAKDAFKAAVEAARERGEKVRAR